MECLTSLIGIDTQCGERTTGLKYINDLPGFNLEMADYLTDNEKQTGIEVLNRCISNAADEIESEFRAFVDPRMKFGSIVNNGRVGFYDRNKQVMAADAGYLGGIQLKIGPNHYLGVYVKSFTIFTPNTYTNEPLYIYDLTQGRLLDTIEFSSVADEITEISVNKLYKSNGQAVNLFVCYAAGTSYKTDVINGGCGSCGWRDYPMDGYLVARSGKILSGNDEIENAIQASSHCYGLSVNYQLMCDSSNLVCQLAPRLKMAMFYKSGIKWCDEIIYGKRLNSLTTVQKADAINLKSEWIGKYEQAMKMVLENMALPNDVCFQCESIISVKRGF